MATISDPQQASSSTTQQRHTLLIATGDEAQRSFLAAQLDADGHTIYEAHDTRETVARLSEQAIDVLILGQLEHPADAPRLLRAIRADEHPRIHPGQPVVTLGPDDELTVLRAYESGSDHHLADSCGYLLLRAILAAVTRRTLETITSRHLHVGQIHIDLAARAVDVAGQAVCLSRLEFELLAKFASDPVRVFSRQELARCIWRQQNISGRTIESHVCRLRHQLVDAGSGAVIINKWGHGWALTSPH
jgi:two-component system KDP operon response regulator KdpE